jgi:HK97 family phage prohead protease
VTITTSSLPVLIPPEGGMAFLRGEQHRAASVEHIDADAGTILMRAVPYDVETALGPRIFESFAPEAFARAAAAPSRCKLWHEHGGPLIGHAASVEDRPDGAWILAKLSNTLAAQEARELAIDGSLDQVSVTFKPMPDWYRVEKRSDGIHVRHSRAALLGVALVAHGAYGEHAAIASVRDDDETSRARARDAALARLRSLNA